MSELLNLPNRIYAQYADKPKFVEWMNITRKIGLELKEGAEQVRKCFDIETAKGDALEVIGRIVVIDRIKDKRLLNSGVFPTRTGQTSTIRTRRFLSCQHSQTQTCPMKCCGLRSKPRSSRMRQTRRRTNCFLHCRRCFRMRMFSGFSITTT